MILSLSSYFNDLSGGLNFAMVKKGIIGGTFDPVHNGHIEIANEAVNLLDLEKLLFIPAGNPPHKTDKIITNADLRICMLNMAIRNINKFELCTYEVDRGGLSFTYETLSYLKHKEPNTEWYFITGADCLMQLESWKNVNIIMSFCNFVVFTRPGYDLHELYIQKKMIEKKYNKEIIFFESANINISSSDIRYMIKNNKDIKGLVPREVKEIITEKKLYV